MPKRACAVIWAVTAAAALVLARWSPWSAPVEVRAWAEAAALAGMAAVFQRARLRLPGQGSVSVVALVLFFGVTTLPTAPAVWATAVGILLGELQRGRDARKVAFNTAQYVIAVAAASCAYGAVGGGLGHPFAVRSLGAYFAMVAVFVGANVGLVSLLFGALEGQPAWRFFASTLSMTWPNQVIFALLGLFVNALYVQLGGAAVVFIFPFLVAVRYGFKLYLDAQSFYLQIVKVLIKVLEFKDPFTGGHSRRVAQVAEQLGSRLGFVDRRLEILKGAALLHDIGKVVVPDALLVKPGPLTVEERRIMDRHAFAGGEILREAEHLRAIAAQVEDHHEHYDGTGYPRGLRGNEIPLASRIIAVADAFDAMISDRPYRTGLPVTEALARLGEAAGGQFDPQVVRTLYELKGYDPETGLLEREDEGAAADETAAARPSQVIPLQPAVLAAGAEAASAAGHWVLGRRAAVGAAQSATTPGSAASAAGGPARAPRTAGPRASEGADAGAALPLRRGTGRKGGSGRRAKGRGDSGTGG